MKKILFTMVLAMSLSAAASASYLCVAIAHNCGFAAVVQVPEGGSCLTVESGQRATATAYDAAGSIVDFNLVRCPFTPC